jgi:hypothetical protein
MISELMLHWKAHFPNTYRDGHMGSFQFRDRNNAVKLRRKINTSVEQQEKIGDQSAPRQAYQAKAVTWNVA